MKINIKIIVCILLTFFLTACQPKETANEIKVGTISGPETQLMEIAKTVAKNKYNLDVNIVEFTDYTMPNVALNDGSIDANVFQHQPYLDTFLKSSHDQLVAIGKTFVYPMGIYSHQIKNIRQVPSKAIVAIPNDPSNEARALLLLSKAGLITLKSDANTNATPVDIAKNPLQLQFKELDAAQLPRVLSDVTLAIINTNYAIPAGLYPNKDAIFMEDKTSPYTNLIVVRAVERDNPKLQELVEALHSPEVSAAAKQLFDGQAIAAW